MGNVSTMSVSKKNELSLDVVFHDLKPNEEIPKSALYLLDSSGKVQSKVASIVQGKVTLDLALVADDQKVLAFGPDDEDLSQIRHDSLMQFRIGDHLTIWKKTKTIEITKNHWHHWTKKRVCLSGKVRKCVSPYIVSTVEKAVAALNSTPVSKAVKKVAALNSTPEFSARMPYRCFPVCNGYVEIYARECCINPIDVPNLVDKLKAEVVWTPIIPPPHPPPDGIVPPSEVRQFSSGVGRSTIARLMRSGSPDVEAMIFESSLSQDIKAIQTLNPDEATRYILERPYLCDCASGSCSFTKLGEVILGPDGQFTFCYNKRPSGTNCQTSYYFKVKQWHENKWEYIYGSPPSSKREYFRNDQFADLTTYEGRACAEDTLDVPHDKPFVMLEWIGSTKSFELISHWGESPSLLPDIDKTQKGEDKMKTPLPANAGLVNPAPPRDLPPADSVTSSDGHNNSLGTVNYSTLHTVIPSWWGNCPWARDLTFTIHFHPLMQADPIKAYYYRITIQSAKDGEPDGITSEILTTPLSWLRHVYVDGKPQVKLEPLGPVPLTGEAGLYKIPFDEGDDGKSMNWVESQHHGVWNTHELLTSGKSKFPNGQYLVAVEVFDKNGIRLSPTDGKFYYFRWLEETGDKSISKVPFAKLQHLFWIDNNLCNANIVDLRKNGMPSMEECQFLEGPADSKFSAGFMAYHPTVNYPTVISPTPPETFMYYYTIFYHRGLSGPDRPIETGGRNKPAAESHPLTFGEMLGSNAVGTKCAFAINLRVYARHFNGSRRINEYDDEEQAAFALEIGP
jgi:hypothetical protein